MILQISCVESPALEHRVVKAYGGKKVRLQAPLTSALDKCELCVKSRRGNEEE
jgi:hypothetical protein